MPEKARGNYSGSVSETSLVNGGQGYMNGRAGEIERECGGNGKIGERRNDVLRMNIGS